MILIYKDGITLFNFQTNVNVDVYLDNKKINVVKDGIKWKIDYNFQKSGKYNI